MKTNWLPAAAGLAGTLLINTGSEMVDELRGTAARFRGPPPPSIAHEINQPIAAAVANASVALRFLQAQPPDLDEVRDALGCVVDNGARAAAVIARIRALMKKAPQRKEGFDVNESIQEVLALTR
jgi:phosphoglycerate-specific signal transduction histidine kinase